MFCEECGTKNEKNAAFCESCGHKMSKVKKEKKAEEKKENKNNAKTYAILGGIAVLVIAFMYFNSIFTPEKVAVKYFKAYMSKDADKMASIINMENSDFVSKSILKEKMKGQKKVELANYSVEKQVETNKKALNKTIRIKYIEKNSSNEKTKSIRLVKNKKNKLLFFENWSVDPSELIARDVKISAPKDAKIKINGKELKKSDEKGYFTDYYKISSIIIGKYNVEIELKGFKLISEINVNYNGGNISLSKYNLPKEEKAKVEKDIEEKINSIYKNVIDGKEWDDIKNNFSEELQETSQYIYGNMKSNSRFYGLKEIEFKDIEITNISVYDEKLSVNFKSKYKYVIVTGSDDDKKEYKSEFKDTNNITTYYKKDDKGYKMVKLPNSYISFRKY